MTDEEYERNEGAFVAKKQFKPAVAIDFDGVLHAYTTTWTCPGEIHDGPTPGALEAVKEYEAAGFDLIVYSARAQAPEGKAAIREWLKKHGFPSSMMISKKKPSAVLYIDDRGYHFDGTNWPSVEFLQKFRPWNRK